MLGVGVFSSPNMVQAAHLGEQNYDYLWTATNIYEGETIDYNLDDLTPTTQYVFELQQVSTEDGSTLLQVLQSKIVIGTATTALIFTDITIPGANWSETNQFAAMRVVDNFGRVLGHHVIAPAPFFLWTTSGGTSDEDFKTAINRIPYVPLYNSAGFQHTRFTTLQVASSVGDYALLHYRISDANPIDENIEIRNVEAGGLLATYDLLDLANYQQHEDLFPLTPSTQNRNSFVVLSTNGIRPPFIDVGQETYAFVTQDNPHLLTAPLGIYNYARETLPGVLLEYGESVWVVTSGNPLISEWALTVRETVKETFDQTATLDTKTSAVWDGYDVTTLIDDIEGALIIPAIYEASFDNIYAAGVANPNVFVIWTAEATTLDWWPTPADINFTLTERYTILADLPWEVELTNLISDRAASTGFDRNVIVMGIMLFIILFILFLARGFGVANRGLAIWAFLIVTGITLIRGYLDLWAAIPLAFVMLFVFVFTIRSSPSEMGEIE